MNVLSILLPSYWSIDDHFIPYCDLFPIRFVEKSQLYYWDEYDNNNSENIFDDLIFDISLEKCLEIDWIKIVKTFLINRDLKQWENDRVYEICTALHEAMTNNILWSNLNLKNEWNRKDDPFSLQSIINKKLKNPEYSNKPIRFSMNLTDDILSIEINHFGESYNFDSTKKLPLYKGTSIIKSFCTKIESVKSGKGIKMFFKNEAEK